MNMEIYKIKINNLRQSVIKMLIERREIKRQEVASNPSNIWSEVLSIYKYLLNLSEEDYMNIRFHTGLITGESIFADWYPYPPIDPDRFAEESGYKLLIKNLPEDLLLGEPPTPGIPRPIGINYKGKIINNTIVRYQKCVSNLYKMGVLSVLSESKNKICIVEIGGGYGGLIHHLSKIFDNKSTCVIIDFPEMFLFSGSYLIVNNPDKNIYVYNGETFNADFIKNRLFEFDYVLLPNYILPELYALPEISLMINLLSFLEMTERQITEYLHFAKSKLKGYLYSDNQDRHPYNAEEINVSKLLENFFWLFPSVKFYEDLSKKLNNLYANRLHKAYVAFTSDNDPLYLKRAGTDFYTSTLSRGHQNKFVTANINELKKSIYEKDN